MYSVKNSMLFFFFEEKKISRDVTCIFAAYIYVFNVHSEINIFFVLLFFFGQLDNYSFGITRPYYCIDIISKEICARRSDSIESDDRD